DSGAGAAVWRVAPVYSGFGVVVWSIDLRGADPQRKSRTRSFALWNFADVPRVLRSDYDSFSAALSFASAALLWNFRHGLHERRKRRRDLAGRREVFARSARDDQSRSADDAGDGPAAGRFEPAGDWAAWRNAGAALS